MTSIAVDGGGMDWLNSLDPAKAEAALFRCCGSRKFATLMATSRPFRSHKEAVETSRDIWWHQVPVPGWLEAFEAHPRIGDVEGLRRKFASTATWCEGEQAAALNSADDAVLQELAEWNRRYEARFGHLFIVCASGRSSAEVLASLQARFPNRPLDELQVAAAEQQKITELRLEKLLSGSSGPAQPAGKPGSVASPETASGPAAPPPAKAWHALSQLPGAGSPEQRRLRLVGAHLLPPPAPAPASDGAAVGGAPAAGPAQAARPPITTHVLDVARGRPAAGIGVTLDALAGSDWTRVGTAQTDEDGRSGALMPASDRLQPGTYRLTFEVQEYLRKHGAGGFYPYVSVAFEVRPSQMGEHFHVPLLLSPFSYSTYRGS